jgi:uncharacterized membrane protein YecN with MAPEG domain
MNPAPMPLVTAFYAGLIGLLLLAAAVPISRLRHSRGISLGDGGDKDLARAIRAHANLVEWGVPAIILLLVAELCRASPVLLHLCGLVLVVGRLLHALGMWRVAGFGQGRFIGTALTWVVILMLAGWNLWAFARVALLS